jgi:hypothetical protein
MGFKGSGFRGYEVDFRKKALEPLNPEPLNLEP